MKKLLSVLSGITLLLSVTSVVADIHCPEVADLKQVNFTKAYNVAEGQWQLIGPFHSPITNGILLAEARLEAKNSSDALVEGKKRFQSSNISYVNYAGNSCYYFDNSNVFKYIEAQPFPNYKNS